MAKLFKYTPLIVANASLRNLAASVHRALLDLLYTLPYSHYGINDTNYILPYPHRDPTSDWLDNAGFCARAHGM